MESFIVPGTGNAGPAGDTAAGPLFDGLNPQQAEAVRYRGHALLILAGAGSGKTKVLTHRIASLIDQREAWPSQILAITFTNKAAAEMRERIERIIGQAAQGMWISTFHSACVRILRREAEHFGYGKNFSIYDSGDSRALIKRLIKEHDLDSFGLTVAGVANKISSLKNELADADSYARVANTADPAEVAFIQVFREYTAALTAANAFDFDDLIAQTVYLFRAFPQVADNYRHRFHHVLVDEYQDTNHAQYALIRELTLEANGPGSGASLTVVGDSDQSIYAFRGADIRNISEFERDFPGAKVILLEQNYRSSQNILSAANAVISNNFDRKDKNLWTDSGDGELIVGYTGYTGHDEAQFVANEIAELHEAGVAYNDIAVFYRTNAQTRALEEIFIRAALPYRVLGGTKFYERMEIKDAIAYLVSIANPRDYQAVRRIINVPKRGIGPATETALAEFADREGITLREALGRAKELGLGPKVTGAILALADLLDGAEARIGTDSVETLLSGLLENSGYLNLLKASRDPQDAARLENVAELLAVTREFGRNNPEGTLADFLTDVSLVAAADELDDSSGTVSLMTLHTAKGLEYHAVFLTGVEEDLLPHRMAAAEPGGPAEERRLFYVGITRARQRLYLSLAMNRAQFGEINTSQPSRYLQEIPAELIDWRQSPGQSGSRGPSSLGYRRDYLPPASESSWPGMSGSRGSTVTKGDRSEYSVTRISGGKGKGSSSTGDSRRTEPAKAWSGELIDSVQDNGDLDLQVGDKVSHAKFGVGTVIEASGIGAKKVARIDFAEGVKKLVVKLAPITKL